MPFQFGKNVNIDIKFLIGRIAVRQIDRGSFPIQVGVHFNRFQVPGILLKNKIVGHGLEARAALLRPFGRRVARHRAAYPMLRHDVIRHAFQSCNNFRALGAHT